MKEIIIKTQKELDNLPSSFKEFTIIKIFGGRYFDRIIVSVAYGNSSVVAYENSSVVAYGNSSVEAYENSSVEAYENSSVVAYENSSVVARENSSVVAKGNSSVVAYGNSSVEAKGNSSVVAKGNSSVVAYENSSVVAYGNSSVEARGNSIIKIFSEYCNIKKALQESVIICIDCKPKLPKHKNIIYSKTATYTKKDFLEIYSDQVQDGKIKLYKSVNPKNDKDFYTNSIEYKNGETVSCPDWNNDKTLECGNGLHLSPTKQLALSYNQGKVKECLVNIKDFVVYNKNITKVRCEKVEVIGEV